MNSDYAYVYINMIGRRSGAEEYDNIWRREGRRDHQSLLSLNLAVRRVARREDDVISDNCWLVVGKLQLAWRYRGRERVIGLFPTTTTIKNYTSRC